MSTPIDPIKMDPTKITDSQFASEILSLRQYYRASAQTPRDVIPVGRPDQSWFVRMNPNPELQES